jgi:hypothetical protein
VFLELYEQTGQLGEAAKTAGISRMLHYRKLQSDPVYQRSFAEAEQRAAQEFEDEAVRRARDGVKRPILGIEEHRERALGDDSPLTY